MPNLSLPISSVHVTNNPHLILLDECNVEVVGGLRLPLLLAAKVPDDLLNVPRLDLHGEPRPLLALLAARDARVVHREEAPLEVAPTLMRREFVFRLGSGWQFNRFFDRLNHGRNHGLNHLISVTDALGGEVAISTITTAWKNTSVGGLFCRGAVLL